MNLLILKTMRLELIAGSLEILEAEIGDRQRFSEILNAKVSSWPPPLNDEHSMNYFAEYYKKNPEAQGWAVWYFILVLEEGSRHLIGNGGFKGHPDETGTVEIGYSLLEKFQNKGLASEAMGRLINWAFTEMNVRQIIAETYPDNNKSLRVMTKNKLVPAGEGSEPGTVRCSITADEYFSKS